MCMGGKRGGGKGGKRGTRVSLLLSSPHRASRICSSTAAEILAASTLFSFWRVRLMELSTKSRMICAIYHKGLKQVCEKRFTDSRNMSRTPAVEIARTHLKGTDSGDC